MRRPASKPPDRRVPHQRPLGQIGQTILPFTRSLALAPDQSSVLMLGASGLTIVPLNFDAPVTLAVITAVVNAADGGAVASGGLISIFRKRAGGAFRGCWRGSLAVLTGRGLCHRR